MADSNKFSTYHFEVHFGDGGFEFTRTELRASKLETVIAFLCEEFESDYYADEEGLEGLLEEARELTKEYANNPRLFDGAGLQVGQFIVKRVGVL